MAALARARIAEARALADAEAERIAEEKEKFEFMKEEKKTCIILCPQSPSIELGKIIEINVNSLSR